MQSSRISHKFSLSASWAPIDGVCFFRKGRMVAGYANLPGAAEAAAKAGTLVGRIP
jgi:hypothetical protein